MTPRSSMIRAITGMLVTAIARANTSSRAPLLWARPISREADGIQAADAFVAEAGGDDVLVNASSTASRTPTTATVTVRGFSLSVIPGWKPVVLQSATVPVERLTATSGEFTNSEGGSGGN